MHRSVNFLPWREYQRQSEKKHYRLLMAFSLFFALFIVLGIRYYITNKINIQVSRNLILERELSPLLKMIDENKGLTEIKKQLLFKWHISQESLTAWAMMVHLLDELSRLCCPGLSLTQLKTKGQRAWVRGQAKSNRHIAHLMKNIENNQWIHSPRLETIKKIQTNNSTLVYEFKLNFTLGSR